MLFEVAVVIVVEHPDVYRERQLFALDLVQHHLWRPLTLLFAHQHETLDIELLCFLLQLSLTLLFVMFLPRLDFFVQPARSIVPAKLRHHEVLSTRRLTAWCFDKTWRRNAFDQIGQRHLAHLTGGSHSGVERLEVFEYVLFEEDWRQIGEQLFLEFFEEAEQLIEVRLDLSPELLQIFLLLVSCKLLRVYLSPVHQIVGMLSVQL